MALHVRGYLLFNFLSYSNKRAVLCFEAFFSMTLLETPNRLCTDFWGAIVEDTSFGRLNLLWIDLHKIKGVWLSLGGSNRLWMNFLVLDDDTTSLWAINLSKTDTCDFGALKQSKTDIFNDVDEVPSSAVMELLLDFLMKIWVGAGVVYPRPAWESFWRYISSAWAFFELSTSHVSFRQLF